MTTPVLPLHRIIPSWTLQDRQGQPFSLFKPRGRAHSLLLVARTEADLVAYLIDLAEPLTGLRQLPARGIVIAPAAIDAPVPWISLIDPESQIAQSYLPAESNLGLFVLDRYNDLYHQWLVATPADLPTPSEVVEWLESIGRQCSI